MAAQRMQLPDGRWHFQHGPMDIVIGADGQRDAVAAAHARAWDRFGGMLDELVQELALLRSPVGKQCLLRGGVARRMWHACQPFSSSFITPMAAVAGAVAQEIIDCYSVPGISRAWVNNGGDIALHLTPAQSLRIGLYADIAQLDAHEIFNGVSTDGQFEVSYAVPVRGVATSGWRGRSFSLGIADSVTVLARTAAEADAAATVIANAVNVADARVVRKPACDVKDNTDLGDIPVTVDVPPLEPGLVRRALQAGLKRASELRSAGLIWSAVLVCQDQFATTSQTGARMLENSSAAMSVGSVFA
jgi:ApbE superfamily uncharacterized protein (UPF0280 family)